MNIELCRREFIQARNLAQSMADDPRSAGTKEFDQAIEAAKGAKLRLDRAEGLARTSAEIERVAGDLVGGGDGSRSYATGRSYGAQFVSSDTMRWLKDSKNSRGAVWNSPASELMATTLDESSGSGGNLVVPHYLPGILALPMRSVTMVDLIAPGVTDSNVVVYMREKTFTNAADTVAEGAAKPESTLVFESVNDPVRKVAHWVPVTEEMLEDVPALRAYLDTRLRLGVDLATDDQLLNGSVVAPDIVGFLARTGLAASIARTAEVNADTVLSQMMAIWIATNLQPDGIVMNPSNWKTCLLTKDANGQYYGGGPFASPHAPTLWGLPVALTTAIAAGTALIGCFKTAAQLFRKGGLRVEASNSHSDFFVKNLIAIRAEQRLALAVYRPSAFGTVTNLT